MDSNIWVYIFAGFIAQLVDGALGMAYGVTASSLLATSGVSPQIISATVHAAEFFATGCSAVSHHYFGNIDKALFRRLVIPGVVGAVVGAYILSSIPGEVVKPYISFYLLMMGVIVMVKAFRISPPVRVAKHLILLGFSGAFIDAIGGGGWGPIVASTLISRGSDTRTTVGTVNAVEFFVTLAITLTFVLTIGLTYWKAIFGLAVGGVIAAPLGAYACKKLPTKPFMLLVGLLIIFLSLRTLMKYFGWL